jgi:putative FmdB family regulatory protein
MATYEFCCQRCETRFDEWHSMKSIPDSVACPACGATADRQFATPAFSTRGDDLLDNGKPQYCPGLARKMPYGKEDPQAYFTSKTKAREAARRKADTGDYQLHFD